MPGMGAPLLSRLMRQGGDFDLDRTKPSAAHRMYISVHGNVPAGTPASL